MRDNPRLRSRAHTAAVILSGTTGLFLLLVGIQGVFTLGANDTWMSILLLLVYAFSMLPLSIAGMFRPRAAAIGMMASLGVYLVWWAGEVAAQVGRHEKLGFDVTPLLLFPLPCLVSSLLFFYSSSSDVSSQGSVSRRSQAKWTAIAGGLLMGAFSAPWGMHWILTSAKQGDWVSASCIGAVSLSLLPFSLLAILKPRMAALGILASLIMGLAYVLTLQPFRAGGSGMLGEILVALLLMLPLAGVAGLLWYSTKDVRPQVE